MQQSKHTALPWYRGSAVVGQQFDVFDDTRTRVLRVSNRVDDEANAAYIVRACNVHYELLEALKAVQLFHYGCNWHHEDDCSLSCGGPVCDCGCDLVKEAIRKAESE